jgi:hypothetical protein
MFEAPPPSHTIPAGQLIVYDPPVLISICQNCATLAVFATFENATVKLPPAITLKTFEAAKSKVRVPLDLVPKSRNCAGILKYGFPCPLIGA